MTRRKSRVPRKSFGTLPTCSGPADFNGWAVVLFCQLSSFFLFVCVRGRGRGAGGGCLGVGGFRVYVVKVEGLWVGGFGVWGFYGDRD